MTIYYYHPITESVTLSTYRTTDQVGRDLRQGHIEGVIYFEAEEILDQTIDESVWKPYVKPIEVGDIVQADLGPHHDTSARPFKVLGVHEDLLWIRGFEDLSTYEGYLVRAAGYHKVAVKRAVSDA